MQAKARQPTIQDLDLGAHYRLTEIHAPSAGAEELGAADEAPGEVDATTFREVTAQIDVAHDQLARERNRLASEAAMPELPDPSLAWEDLSAVDRRALTEML